MPEVTERPILFSAPMIQALRAGRKTQTRRIIRLDAKTILSAGQRKLGWTYSLDHVRVGDVGKMISAIGTGKARPQISQQISIAAAFAELWGKINGPESWNENPWVWALGFKVLEDSK